MYLKISELILRAIGSEGGIPPPEPLFRPPRLACPTEAVRRREAEAKRTNSSFHSAFSGTPSFARFGGKFFLYFPSINTGLSLMVMVILPPLADFVSVLKAVE